MAHAFISVLRTSRQELKTRIGNMKSGLQKQKEGKKTGSGEKEKNPPGFPGLSWRCVRPTAKADLGKRN